MTERISHEEARAIVEERIGLFKVRGQMLDYITQQQTLEADTVSKEEHERKLEEQKDALLGAFRRREEEHEAKVEVVEAHWFGQLNDVVEKLKREHESKLTALQAEHERKLEEQKDALMGAFRRREEEHERALARIGDSWQATCDRALATERARAEAAERLARAAASALSRRVDKLAAANARAERLEEAGLVLAHWYLRQWPGSVSTECLAAKAIVVLSTAPQASTEQGCTEYDAETGYCARPDCPVCNDGSTEQASPSPAESGGTERCDHDGVPGDSCSRCTTPAEPQGSPEQAGDRVDQLRSDIVAAARHVGEGRGFNTHRILCEFADELERGGK